MSASLLLDALRRHNLQDYYPSLSSQGIFKVDKLAQLSEAEYSKLGVRSAADKLKFLKLVQDMKEMIKKNEAKEAKSEPPPVSKKRPSSIVSSRHSPESKKTRRMTLAPQTTIPKQPQLTKATARDRRLSYMPSTPVNNRRESFYRSPTRPTHTKLASPQRQKATSVAKPIMKPEAYFELPKEPIEEKPSARHLDAYGIPVQTPKKTALTPEHRQQVTLEEFMSSKTKTTPVKNHTTTIVSTSVQPAAYNELHQRIRVCVRKRPLSKREIANQESDIAPLVGSRTIQLNAPKTRIDLTRYTEAHTFTFDDTFDSSTSNTQIYARTAKPLVEYIFTGGKATCFAHGQTGSGKTYTMLDPEHGLYVLAAQDIFRMLSSPDYVHLSASVGFYEIYQGQLFDLLNMKAKLVAREDGNGNVVIAGLREFPIETVDDLLTVFEYGNQGRTIGKTGANNKSSRSHAVLQILLRVKQDPAHVHGKLSFIDLAGSERGADRGDANTKTRLEGAEINKSLLALKECIRALDQNKIHTPFRGSKLTQVLRDSFTGDSRTCMIATISPNNSNSEHTLNTLRYADRVKQLRGESDPRLLGDGGVKNNNQQEMIEDSQSLTNSDSFLEDVSENILDVDIPSEVASNALATPTNDRYYKTQVEPTRQANYMKRLESPPADVFDDHKQEDPFFSKPTSPKVDPKPTGIDITRIKRFMRLHRAQVKEMEDCIRDEKRMLDRLNLTISSSELREENEDDDIEDQQSKEEYETYLNDLEEIMDRKYSLMNAVSQKIKEELEE